MEKTFHLKYVVPVHADIFVATSSNIESKDKALEKWTDLTNKMTLDIYLVIVNAEQWSLEDIQLINKPQESLREGEKIYAEKLRACINLNVDKLPIHMVKLIFLCTQTIDEPVQATSEDEAVEQFWNDGSIDPSGIYDGFFFQRKEFEQSDFIFEARVVEAHVTASEKI